MGKRRTEKPKKNAHKNSKHYLVFIVTPCLCTIYDDTTKHVALFSSVALNLFFLLSLLKYFDAYQLTFFEKQQLQKLAIQNKHIEK